MEGSHGCNQTVHNHRRDAVVGDLEEAEVSAGAADLVDDGGAGSGEVDGGDWLGVGSGGGLELL